MPTRPPRLLFVCTANVNRSPTAEHWAVKHLADRFVMGEVRSAGTVAIDVMDSPEAAEAFRGHPFSTAGAYAVEAMREHGIDMSAHRTRRLKADTLAWADAVVVMEPAHAAVAHELDAELAERKVVGLWEFAEGDLSKIWDPQGQSPDRYQASAALIGDAVGRFVETFMSERRERLRRERAGE